MEVYRPMVLSLKQLCAHVVRNNEDMLGDMRELPNMLIQYVKESKPGFVYVGVVDCTNETMRIWMDCFTKEEYDWLVGKTVYQCLLCKRIDHCHMFLKEFRTLNLCMFPDSPPPICFCCGRPAFVNPSGSLLT